MNSIYEYQVVNAKGEQIPLENYKGNVLLIVNTASRCGFTPQYEGLQKLFSQYKDKGFYVLGFPCNQFGNQEPGNMEEIQNFCSINYSITFPLFHKIEVNGPNAHPLFEYLKNKAPGILGTKEIKWNFTKFLIDRNGKVVKRYSPMTKPEEIQKDIEKLL